MKKKLILILWLWPMSCYGQTIQDLWPAAEKQQEFLEIKVLDTLKQIDVIRFHDNEFLNPGLIKVRESTILVYDFYMKQLYSVNRDNDPNLIEEIGRGNGSGPGEYRFVGSIDLDEHHNRYTLDTELLRLSVWDSNNELKGVYNLGAGGGIPGKIATDGESLILKYAFAGNSEYQFGLISKDGNLLHRFYELNTWMNIKSPLLYEGHISAQKGKIVYASVNYGVFMLLDLEGNLVFTKQMIDPLNGLEMEVRQSGFTLSTTVKNTSRIVTLSLDLTKDKIFILYSGSRSLQSNRIDVYDVTNGHYICTFILDEYVNDISVDGENLFAIVPENENEKARIVIYQLSMD